MASYLLQGTMSAAELLAPAARLTGDDSASDMAMDAALPGTAAEDAGQGVALPHGPAASPEGTATDAPPPSPDTFVQPHCDEVAAAIPTLAVAEAEQLGRIETDGQPEAAEADPVLRSAVAASMSEEAPAAAVQEEAALGSPVMVPDAAPPAAAAATVGDDLLAATTSQHSSSDGLPASSAAALASAPPAVEVLQSSEPSLLPAAERSQPTANVLATSPGRRSLDSNMSAAADAHLAAPDAATDAQGRSSIDGYRGAASAAITTCSSDALTAELLLSDDEDRPRSGHPLMLRWRYGTPGGPSLPEDAAESDDASAAEADQVIPAPSPPAPRSASLPIGPQFGLIVQLPSGSPPPAADEHTDHEGVQRRLGAAQQRDAAGEPLDENVAHAALLSVRTAAEDGAGRERGENGVPAEHIGVPGSLEGVDSTAQQATPDAPAAAVPAMAIAAAVAAGTTPIEAADGSALDGDVNRWRVPGATTAALPAAAVAARYQRSESSPAVAAVQHPAKVTAVFVVRICAG